MSDELAARRRQIEETMVPWFQDPPRIARLLRWLVWLEEPPKSIPDFIENCQSWQEKYEEMCLFEGAGAGGRDA